MSPAVLADTFGSGPNTFEIEFVPIGNPGNPDDTTGKPNPAGKVDYAYRISKYEISEGMVKNAIAEGGRIIFDGNLGADKPATSIQWLEAARFVNWLNTSQGHHEAYRFTGSGSSSFELWDSTEAWQIGGENRLRHKDAVYFLPSADEWYKAAYFDPTSGAYYDYPTGSDSTPDGIDFAGDPTFDLVFNDGGENPQPNDITDVGLLSPYGTAGQGGNVMEWNETETDVVVSGNRIVRGGHWGSGFPGGGTAVSTSSEGWLFGGVPPANASEYLGFRVASMAIPEPSTCALLTLFALASTCRYRMARH